MAVTTAVAAGEAFVSIRARAVGGTEDSRGGYGTGCLQKAGLEFVFESQTTPPPCEVLGIVSSIQDRTRPSGARLPTILASHSELGLAGVVPGPPSANHSHCIAQIARPAAYTRVPPTSRGGTLRLWPTLVEAKPQQCIARSRAAPGVLGIGRSLARGRIDSESAERVHLISVKLARRRRGRCR